MTTYKDLIKKLTIELDINELELSKRLGISQQTLTERKKNNATKYIEIIELCLENQIDLNSLFQEDHKLIEGITTSTITDNNGFAQMCLAYNSYKIPQEFFMLLAPYEIGYTYKITTIETDILSPEIKNNDSVIIATDHPVYRVKDGSIVVFRFKNQKEILYRKLYILSQNQYSLVGNNNIPSIIIDKDDIDILGVVVSTISRKV